MFVYDRIDLESGEVVELGQAIPHSSETTGPCPKFDFVLDMGLLMHSELNFVLGDDDYRDPARKLEFFRLFHDYNLIYRIQERPQDPQSNSGQKIVRTFEVKKNIESKIPSLQPPDDSQSASRQFTDYMCFQSP